MKETKISTRYAKALFDLALEKGIEDKVKDDMLLLKEIFGSSKDLVKIIISPVIRNEVKDKILKSIFSQQVHPLSMSFISLIVRKGREGLVIQVAVEYISKYKEFKGIKTAFVKTARKLDNTTRQMLIEKLKNITQKQVELVEEVKEDLIGGMVLKIDDQQYDDSILSKLKKLKKDFKDNLYVKGF